MKPANVIEELEKIGVFVTRRTLLRYEKEGLISEPYLRTGKETEYLPDVVGDFYASWSLIHGEVKCSSAMAAIIRKMGLVIESGNGLTPIDWVFGSRMEMAKGELANQWYEDKMEIMGKPVKR